MKQHFVWIFLLTCLLGQFACQPSPGETAPSELVIPAIHTLVDHPGFRREGGMLCLEGKPYSGWQFALSEQGDTLLEASFYQGKEQGWERQWYLNGQLAQQRYYRQGKKEGLHQGWYPTGQKRFVYHLKADVYDGPVLEWYENGQLFRHFHYQAGQEQGLEQSWKPDGQVWANYEVRNGRKYGLTGVKHCESAL